MNFFHPQMLWLFAGLPVLAALYLLRVRPQREPTTAYFLWQEIFGDNRSSALWGKLKNLLGLLLMLLASTLAILAAAGPYFGEQRQKDLVIAIDTSASMRAAAGGTLSTTRFAEAKRKCLQFINALPPYQRCAIAAVGRELSIPTGFTSSRRALCETIEKIEPGYAGADPKVLKNIDIPTSQQQNGRDADYAPEIMFMSDMAFAGEQLPEHIRLLKTSEKAENIGICGLDMMRMPASDNVLVWCRLVSAEEKRKLAAEVLVYYTPDESSVETLVKVIPLELTPGLNKPFVFTVDAAGSGEWRLELQSDDITDALQEDNVAYYLLPAIKPAQVSIDAGKMQNFYGLAVNAFANEQAGLVVTDKNPEIQIVAGSVPEFKPGKRYIVFCPPEGSQSGIGTFSKDSKTARVRKVVDDHQATKFLDLESRLFGGVKDVRAKQEGLVLFSAVSDDEQPTPLIYKSYPNGATVWVCNFDPLYGHFILSPYFPVLIKSLSEDLLQRSEQVRRIFRPGECFPKNSKLVSAPYQMDKTDAYGMFTIPGFYTFETQTAENSEKFTVSCSLLSDKESMINNFYKVPEKQKQQRSEQVSFAPLLLVLAMLIFIAEEVLYHRRKVD